MELTLLIVLPLLGALVVAFLPKERTELVFPVALGLSILPLAAALWIMVNFVSGEPLFQFTEDYVLSDTFGIAWRVGVDGISLWMIVLTGLLMTLAIAASKSITDRPKQYMVAMLVLEAGLTPQGDGWTCRAKLRTEAEVASLELRLEPDRS